METKLKKLIEKLEKEKAFSKRQQKSCNDNKRFALADFATGQISAFSQCINELQKLLNE